jgi:hypothetical protein
VVNGMPIGHGEELQVMGGGGQLQVMSNDGRQFVFRRLS